MMKPPRFNETKGGLTGLSEALGNDDFWDFEDLANMLYDIAHENKFEQDFEQ